MTDQELLADVARSGSPQAFAALVERHTQMVYGTCLRILKDPHAAEDAHRIADLRRSEAGKLRDEVEAAHRRAEAAHADARALHEEAHALADEGHRVAERAPQEVAE